MKTRSTLIYYGPILCVLFAFTAIYILIRDVPRATSSGEHLRLSRLAPSEQVVIEKYFSHGRDLRLRVYLLGIDGEPNRFDAFDASGEWKGGLLYATPQKLLASRKLSERELMGLETMLAYFRAVREEDSSATRGTRISYLRAGSKIGEEFFVGFSLPDQLAYYDRQGYRGDPAYDSDYTRLAEGHGISRAGLDSMVTPEMLEKAPNKAPEPTPGAVTPRATEGALR